MILQAIVGTNNHGIALMQHGQYDLAIEKFREAQFYARQYVHPDGYHGSLLSTTTNTVPASSTTTTSSTTSAVNGNEGSFEAHLIIESPTTSAVSTSSESVNILVAFNVPATQWGEDEGTPDIGRHQDFQTSGGMETDVSPHNVFSIYSEAFVLVNLGTSSPSTPGGDLSLEEYMTVGAVPLFNTALALHLYGMSLSGNPVSNVYLRNALQLYKFAISILDESFVFEELQDYPFHLQILLMAAYSNAGHIHSHFMDDVELVLNCQDQLQSLYGRVSPEVMQILALHENSQASLTFLWNTLLPSLQPCGRMSLAPAA
jgi:hypothetical protein